MKTKENMIIKNSKTKKELEENEVWDKDKLSKIREFILSESEKQSSERKLKNEILSIKYQIQDYLENNNIDREMRILDFVKLYLKLFNITQKEFAFKLGMIDTNLYKYLIGERKLNPDIVMKLSSFSNTQPELWYYIQTKNQLFELSKKKDKMKKYQKYKYEKLLGIEE